MPRHTPPPSPRPRAALLAALAVTLGACGADDGRGTVAPADTAAVSDTLGGVDGIITDTSASDAVSPSDTSRPDTTEETSTAAVPLKEDDTFLVPGGVALRTQVAISGDGRVAWVERPTPGAEPRLVVWSGVGSTRAPDPFAPPHLTAPRELVLVGERLVYVDTRYGDADVFVLDLTTGADAAIVARHGEQAHPASDGVDVVWEDCRGCLTGDDGAARELFRRPLAGGPEVNLTSDATSDRAPVFGTLADGTPALAWIAGAGTLRVSAGALDVAHPTGEDLLAVSLTKGVLAWRRRPLIINPDSMIPSDVFVTRVADGATFPATFHAERAAASDGAPRAAAGRIAWIEAAPPDPAASILRVVDAETLADALALPVGGVVERLAISPTLVALTAPRADNDGLDDVWVLRLP